MECSKLLVLSGLHGWQSSYQVRESAVSVAVFLCAATVSSRLISQIILHHVLMELASHGA